MNFWHRVSRMLRDKVGASRRASATLKVRLGVEFLEDRLTPSSSAFSVQDYEIWRSARFQIDAADFPSAPSTAVVGPLAATQTIEGGTLIGLDKVQEQYSYRGTGYTVAVIDTGIDYRNPALGGGWGTRVVGGWDFVNNDSDPMDDQGHGTHVAGIIGSSDTAHLGIAPDVRFVALKVLGADGSGNFGAVEDALKWVAAHQQEFNIVAVNMSLGSGNYLVNPFDFLDDELAQLKQQGVFVAVASGNSFYSFNSQQGMGFPAVSADVVSVGAVWAGDVGPATWASGARDYTTGPDRITSFTQRNANLDLVAPGAMITSTHLNNTWRAMAGTSMATPVVAGAAAILHQALDAQGQSSQANQDAILQLMRSTGKSVLDGDDENDNVVNTGLTFKRLDLFAALQSIGADTGNPTNHAPELSPIPDQSATVNGSVTVNLQASDADGDIITFSAQVVGGASPAYQLRQSLGLTYVGSYFQNSWGQNEKWLLGTNNAWYFLLPNGDFHRWVGDWTNSVQSGNKLASLGAAFYADPSLLWNAPPSSGPNVGLLITGNQLKITPPTGYTGTFQVAVSASDGRLTSARTFTVTVQQNQAPILGNLPDISLSPGTSRTIPLAATDPDGDPITYSAKILGAQQAIQWLWLNGRATINTTQAPTVSVAGNQLTLNVPAGFTGSFQVEATASDGKSASSKVFTVSTLQNRAPQLAAIPDQTAISTQSKISIDLNASDPDGQAITLKAALGGVHGLAQQLQKNLGLNFAGNYFTNQVGLNEKWLLGSNSQWYLLLPSGELRRWGGSIAGTLQANNLMGTLNGSIYADPSLLWNPIQPGFAFVGQQLQITLPTNFLGSFVVQVTASDGSLETSQTFTVTVAAPTGPTTPTTPAPTTPGVTRSGNTVTVTLETQDSNGKPLTYTAGLNNQAVQLKQQLGLLSLASEYENLYGVGEKWIRGTAGQWYILLPSGDLRRWSGSLTLTMRAQNLIAKLDTFYYDDPSLLLNARAVNATVSVVGNQVKVQVPTSFQGSLILEVLASNGTKKTFVIKI